MSSGASNRPITQGVSIGSYNLGCFVGAVICIFVGDYLGRRRTIFAASFIRIIGAILQATSFGLPRLIVVLLITGIGNGLNNSTVPTCQSELSKPHKRGQMVMMEGSLITAGIMLSYWLDLGFSFLDSNTKTGIAAAVFLFVFNTFFAMGWWGMTRLYPAEIVPLKIRAPSNALSTSGNWIFNFMVVMITPIAFANIKYQAYIIFAVINAFIFPVVYFFYLETAYRSLEEMDDIFRKSTNGFDMVHNAKPSVTPNAYDKHGHYLFNYLETDDHMRRASATLPHGATEKVIVDKSRADVDEAYKVEGGFGESSSQNS